MAYTAYELGEMVANAASAAGINPRIAVEQIRQESSFNPNARSSAGAQGLAQFMPGTWARFGSGSPYDPVAAINAYVRYMGFLLNRYGGDYAKALAAYNAGEGNVDKYGGVPPFAETRNYVNKILSAAGDITGGALSSIGNFVDTNSGGITSGAVAVFLLGLGILILIRR